MKELIENLNEQIEILSNNLAIAESNKSAAARAWKASLELEKLG